MVTWRPRFDACLPIILREEGGNDDDPNDHGGRTSRGITQKEYAAWRTNWGQPAGDVWAATDAEVRAIYLGGYWRPTCPKLPAGIDLLYFNIAVNGGPRRATVILQRVLDIKQDSDEFVHGKEYVGPTTLSALAKADLAALVRGFSAELQRFYESLPQFPRYGQGWTARNQRVTAAALKMLSPSVAKKEPPVTTTTVPAVAPQDLVATIIHYLQMTKSVAPFLGGVETFFPQAAPLIEAVKFGEPVAEELLQAIEDAKSGNKQGGDLVDEFADHLEQVVAHLRSVAGALKKAAAQQPTGNV